MCVQWAAMLTPVNRYVKSIKYSQTDIAENTEKVKWENK